MLFKSQKSKLNALYGRKNTEKRTVFSKRCHRCENFSIMRWVRNKDNHVYICDVSRTIISSDEFENYEGHDLICEHMEEKF